MPPPIVLIVAGISGVGKTTVGRLVAERLGWAFFDADDLHPAENVAKMQRGEGLTDADRAPWLDAVRALIEKRLEEQASAVIACSALKASYRAQLHQDDEEVSLVWLDAAPGLVADRLGARDGHFAGPSLLASQLDAMEEPTAEEPVERISARGPAADVAHRVLQIVSDG